MSEKQFWEEISDKFDEKFDRYTDYFGFDYVLNLLEDISNKNILDYGCGEAQFSSKLAYKGANVYGTDISENALKTAKKKFKNLKNLKFLNLKNEKLFLENIYNLCVSTFVFTCINSSEKIEKIMTKIYFSLKNKGKFIILLPNPESIGKQFYSFRCDAIENLYDGSKVEYSLRGLDEKFEDYWWSDKFMIDTLKKVGFNNIKILKPIPKKDEKWIDERKCPPFVIYIAIK